MVLNSSDFASTCFGVVLGDAILFEDALRRLTDDDEIADRAGGAAGAGTRTSIWREIHLIAVVTVLIWPRPSQNLENAVWFRKTSINPTTMDRDGIWTLVSIWAGIRERVLTMLLGRLKLLLICWFT